LREKRKSYTLNDEKEKKLLVDHISIAKKVDFNVNEFYSMRESH
jgi:hypothetical protein